MPATSDIQQEPAGRHFGEQIGVQNIGRLGGQRQQTHQRVRRPNDLIQPVWAVQNFDPFQRFK
jgi:hypothetical protein